MEDYCTTSLIVAIVAAVLALCGLMGFIAFKVAELKDRIEALEEAR